MQLSEATPQTTGPQPTTVKGQQQASNTPPSGREGCYSSLPSKQNTTPKHKRGLVVWGATDTPPIPATTGRTQPTPSASRSFGAELTGVAISIFGISCSNRSSGQYPNGHLLQRYVTYRQTPRASSNFPSRLRNQLAPNHERSGASNRD